MMIICYRQSELFNTYKSKIFIILLRMRKIEPKIDLLDRGDRKSTRLNSSHQIISYAVFCLKKKRHILLTLLEHICTEGYLRLFLDEGEAMAMLLRPLVLQIHEQPLLAYLPRILCAFPVSHS